MAQAYKALINFTNTNQFKKAVVVDVPWDIWELASSMVYTNKLVRKDNGNFVIYDYAGNPVEGETGLSVGGYDILQASYDVASSDFSITWNAATNDYSINIASASAGDRFRFRIKKSGVWVSTYIDLEWT